jgi:hypothetical protein
VSGNAGTEGTEVTAPPFTNVESADPWKGIAAGAVGRKEVIWPRVGVELFLELEDLLQHSVVIRADSKSRLSTTGFKRASRNLGRTFPRILSRSDVNQSFIGVSVILPR